MQHYFAHLQIRQLYDAVQATSRQGQLVVGMLVVVGMVLILVLHSNGRIKIRIGVASNKKRHCGNRITYNVAVLQVSGSWTVSMDLSVGTSAWVGVRSARVNEELHRWCELTIRREGPGFGEPPFVGWLRFLRRWC
jgi:hypothetical protein